jgi:UDP-N-acetylglucosamine 4,6-dehydratase
LENIDWENLNVLVTGGTGSFGKKLIEIMLRDFHPNKLIIFSRDELKQHEMKMNGFDHPSLRFFIGDVRDKERLHRAMQGSDIIIHAAALKQVPACEYNPFEAVKTNIIGAQNIIDTAIDVGVEKVVALSTDKAVNPVNLYGATKLCAEKMFTQGNSYAGASGTKFSCVRYGNVIGSRGSVIPLFISQKKNGKLTITDKLMTRFWITLEQAVQLVVAAVTHMQGGEIFLPKIPSMKIIDLSRAIAPECEIEFIGIRPGEKIHEILITEEEGRQTIDYKGMYVILPNYSWWNRQNYKTGKKLPKGFTYVSDTNRDWLSVNDLKAIIDNYTDSLNRNSSNKLGSIENAGVMGNTPLNADIYSKRVSGKHHSLAY